MTALRGLYAALKASAVQTLFDRTTGTDLGDLTGGGGNAACFDGTTSQALSSCGRGGTPGYIGKYYSGAAKTWSGYRFYGPNNNNVHGSGATSATLTVKLYIRATGSPSTSTDGTLIDTTTFSDPNTPYSQVFTRLTGPTPTSGESVWIRVTTDSGTDTNVAEAEFYYDA